MKIKEYVRAFHDKLPYQLKRRDKDWFYSQHSRPKYAEQVTVKKTDTCDDKKIFIVIQGGIRYEDDFTVESIKLYQKLYPGAQIVLSTWDYEKSEVLQQIKELGVDVILSSLPQNSGHGSLNYQRNSTLNGVKYAIEQGAEYILKLRTDQRIYAEECITYMLKLLKLYPVRIQVDAGRLVVCSNGCFKNRLYNVSDMLVFGKALDVLRYYSFPIDTRTCDDILEGEDSIEYSKKRPGEIYISTNYIESLGFKLKWTKEDSEFYFRELFIVVDAETLDWYWPKYTEMEYRWRNYGNRKHYQYTFKDWFLAQNS